MFGVDLSHHNYDQGPVNLPALSGAIDFAYIKVTEGGYNVDARWQYWHGGIDKPKAPYHFMGQRGNWVDQVAKFVGQYSQRAWQWGPVLDVEFNSSVQSGGPTSADIRAWVAEWRRQTGQHNLYVYVGKADLVGACPPSQWADDGTRIIGARYYTNDFAGAFDNIGFNDPRLDIVQYWNKGRVAGLTGDTDLNNARSLAQGGVDMLADERAALFEIRNQLTGSPVVGEFPGWPSFVNPQVKLTLMDFVRYIDKATNASAAALAGIAHAIDNLPPAQITQITADPAAVVAEWQRAGLPAALGVAVVDALGAKLNASPPTV
jgi:GH25 family lysozyme M1 (1,4-beta-N-acetylmuramidase)